jgi:hypothetical protein
VVVTNDEEEIVRSVFAAKRVINEVIVALLDIERPHLSEHLQSPLSSHFQVTHSLEDIFLAGFGPQPLEHPANAIKSNTSRMGAPYWKAFFW